MSNKEICGYISLLYSVAEKPLDLWSKHVSFGGKIRRIKDDTLHGDKVIEVTGPHDSAILTNITIPAKTLDVLNIKLPILVLIIKNLNLRFKLEVQIIDKIQYRRRFSFMTYNIEKLPNINANVARIPLKLEECWNSLEINLQTLCCEIYGTDYEALQRIIVYPNCHLRRVYLQDRHYNHDETPVKMYEAFFDMYMSKWGANFIERTCQTEECNTGSAEQSNLNCFTKDDSISKSQSIKVDIFKNIYSLGKLDNLNLSSNMINLCNSNTLKRNHMSLDILNNAIKARGSQDILIRQSECFTSLINDPIIENKFKKESKTTKKEQNAVKIQGAENLNSLINIKINSHTSQAASSVELKGIAKSQFLKMHNGEMLFKDKRFPKNSYSQRIQNPGDIYVNSRNRTVSLSNNNVQTGKNDVNSMDAKLGVSAIDFSSTCKLDLSENIKFNKINNIFNTQSNELDIISKDKYVKENENSIVNHSRFLNAEESIEDTTENMSKRIPSLIEKEAKLDEVKSRSTYLTTDTAVFDFLAARCSVNRRFLEKLRDKGVVTPQIELYNVTNRRNSCGQEKFIEKQRWCIDKCL